MRCANVTFTIPLAAVVLWNPVVGNSWASAAEPQPPATNEVAREFWSDSTSVSANAMLPDPSRRGPVERARGLEREAAPKAPASLDRM